ncbi:MAG: DUF4428 domain-containing protein [Coriobacteriales bacterium]|nr:DUF4428 domain-containing protein [Coriobacteriales bacterium]
MGLFNRKKKTCAVCGKELGLFGKVKIADDQVICKECSGKLSPYFTGRRSATVDQIIDQLEYREQNKAVVADLNPTRTLGNSTKVYIDDEAGKLAITNDSNWRNANPDIFDFEQITGCEWEVEEDRTEIKRELEDGREVSYNPPHYEYEYDFYVTVQINHPYVSSIRFKVNTYTIELRNSAEYNNTERIAKEIHAALTDLHKGVQEARVAANTPKKAVVCPHCMATTMPDANGCCEYCGGALE